MARSSSRADASGGPSTVRKATRHPMLNDCIGSGACQQVTVNNMASTIPLTFGTPPPAGRDDYASTAASDL